MDNKSLSHTMEIPIPYRIYSEISKEGIVWKNTRDDVREIISTLCKYKDV
jgi:putative transposase